VRLLLVAWSPDALCRRGACPRLGLVCHQRWPQTNQAPRAWACTSPVWSVWTHPRSRLAVVLPAPHRRQNRVGGLFTATASSAQAWLLILGPAFPKPAPSPWPAQFASDSSLPAKQAMCMPSNPFWTGTWATGRRLSEIVRGKNHLKKNSEAAGHRAETPHLKLFAAASETTHTPHQRLMQGPPLAHGVTSCTALHHTPWGM